MSDDRPLTDAELIALAALANVDAYNVQAANMQRADLGQSMAYDCVESDAAVRLRCELERRGVL